MKWIKVGDATKPPLGKLVIVFTDKGVGVSRYRGDDDFEFLLLTHTLTQFNRFDVTHWMPMPHQPIDEN